MFQFESSFKTAPAWPFIAGFGLGSVIYAKWAMESEDRQYTQISESLDEKELEALKGEREVLLKTLEDVGKSTEEFWNRCEKCILSYFNWQLVV